MKFPLACLPFLAFALAAHAQSPCPSPDLSGHPGAWKPRAGYRGAARFKAPPGSYNRAAADATLDKLLALLQAAYPEPMGGVAYFTKYLLFSTPYREQPFGYSLYVGHSRFDCTSSNRLVEAGESGVAINVDVNSLDLLDNVGAPEISTSAGPLKVNAGPDGDYLIGGRRVHSVPATHDRFRGADRYTTPSRVDGAGIATGQYFILRPEGKPFWTYVTRRQYLNQFRGELGTYKSRELEGFRANAGTPGASTPEWQAKFAKGMDAYIRAVDVYLKSAPDADLNRPVSAFLPLFPIDIDNPTIRFREGDSHFVLLDPGYFDTKLPHHIPQFVVIRLNIRNMANPPAWERRFREAISNRVDFAAIQAMLGKP